MLAADGRACQREPEGWAQPHPGWTAVLDAQHQWLQVTWSGGLPWFTGLLPVTRDWRRAARNAGAVLQITGPFAHPTEGADAGPAGDHPRGRGEQRSERT